MVTPLEKVLFPSSIGIQPRSADASGLGSVAVFILICTCCAVVWKRQVQAGGLARDHVMNRYARCNLFCPLGMLRKAAFHESPFLPTFYIYHLFSGLICYLAEKNQDWKELATLLLCFLDLIWLATSSCIYAWTFCKWLNLANKYWTHGKLRNSRFTLSYSICLVDCGIWYAYDFYDSIVLCHGVKPCQADHFVYLSNCKSKLLDIIPKVRS